MQVLLVSRNSLTRRSIEALLCEAGHNVRAAGPEDSAQTADEAILIDGLVNPAQARELAAEWPTCRDDHMIRLVVTSQARLDPPKGWESCDPSSLVTRLGGAGLSSFGMPLEAIDSHSSHVMQCADLREVFHHSPIPILILSGDGQILRSNRQRDDRCNSDEIGRLLGCARSVAQGGVCEGPWSRTEACTNCVLRDSIRQTLESRRSFHRMEVKVPQAGPRENNWVHALLTSIAVEYDHQPCALIYLEDITRLKQSIEKVESFNGYLEHKVAERTREMLDLLARQKQFIHHLGHDLRTPLTPLVALLPILEERCRDDTQANELYRLFEESIQAMRTLVERTFRLLWAGELSGRIELRPTDLVSLIAEVADDHRLLLHRSRAELEIQVPDELEVLVGAAETKELLSNLLSNARAAMPAGGRITIGAYRHGRELLLGVRDEGVGIAAEQLDNIFEPFHKLDDSRHDRESTGLGLAICRGIVEAQGGRIWAESDGPGRGTCIWFSLRTPEQSSAGSVRSWRHTRGKVTSRRKDVSCLPNA